MKLGKLFGIRIHFYKLHLLCQWCRPSGHSGISTRVHLERSREDGRRKNCGRPSFPVDIAQWIFALRIHHPSMFPSRSSAYFATFANGIFNSYPSTLEFFAQISPFLVVLSSHPEAFNPRDHSISYEIWSFVVIFTFEDLTDFSLSFLTRNFEYYILLVILTNGIFDSWSLVVESYFLASLKDWYLETMLQNC